MNNPHKLTTQERAITPAADFNKGINCNMPQAKRMKKKNKSKVK